LNVKFTEINEILELKKVRGKNRIRSHMCRKFHSTHLFQDPENEEDTEYGLDMEQIDALHSRTKETRSRYFIDNPQVLREHYMKAMNRVTIFHEYDYKELLNEIKIEAGKKYKEELEIKDRENQELKTIIQKNYSA
jgi:hypothetical protein